MDPLWLFFSNIRVGIFLIQNDLQKYVTNRLKFHGLFAQVFTSANFGNNAEQVTFRIFWQFVIISADILVRLFIPIRQESTFWVKTL